MRLYGGYFKFKFTFQAIASIIHSCSNDLHGEKDNLVK